MRQNWTRMCKQLAGVRARASARNHVSISVPRGMVNCNGEQAKLEARRAKGAVSRARHSLRVCGAV